MNLTKLRFLTTFTAVLSCCGAFVACANDSAEPSPGQPNAGGATNGSGGRPAQTNGGSGARPAANDGGASAAPAETNGLAGAASDAGSPSSAGQASEGGALGSAGGVGGDAAGGSAGVGGNPSDEWTELTPLPTVTDAYSFALTANAEGEPRLGFMFQDDTYRQQLLDAGGVLWDGGGVYSGQQVLAIYEPDAATTAWQPYQGRLTPQAYRYSELTFNGADSYYTTSFPSFGGLVSVVKNGGAGSYALTPAFTDRRAHSVGFLNGELYALIAQKNAGLTLSTYPEDEVGTTLNDLWQNIVAIAPDATTVVDPALLAVGTQLVAGYVLDGHAVLRRSSQPATLAAAADFTVVGGCDDAAQLKLATRATTLYRACISAAGSLDLASADLAGDTVTWTPVTSGVVGSVTTADIAASSTGLALAVRQGDSLRVFERAGDATPSFDAVMPGAFDLAAGNHDLLLAVCDLAADAPHTLRAFRR